MSKRDIESIVFETHLSGTPEGRAYTKSQVVSLGKLKRILFILKYHEDYDEQDIEHARREYIKAQDQASLRQAALEKRYHWPATMGGDQGHGRFPTYPR